MNAPELIALLKDELCFAEQGGYRKPSWHPQLIFEDSPICRKFRDPGNLEKCRQCPLIAFVPKAHRDDRLPCRKIPLNAAGDTLDALYRSASIAEIEAVLVKWLRHQIATLEAAPTDHLEPQKSRAER